MKHRWILLGMLLGLLLMATPVFAGGYQIWVTDELEDTVSIIDPEANEVIHTLILDAVKPHNVRFSPAGDLAFIFSVGSSTIHIVDTATHEVIQTIQDADGKANHDGAVTLDGSELWSANTAGNDIAIIDVATWEIIDRIEAPGATPALVNFSPDGRRAYVPQINSGDVAVFDVQTREHLTSIPAGRGAMGTVLFPDREELWVTGGGDNLIAIIDTAYDRLKETIYLQSDPHDLRATSDGRHVVVSLRGSNAVAVIDVRSREVVGAVGTEEQPDMLSISPNGRYAYVANRSSDSVIKIDLVELARVDTIPVGWGPHGVATQAK